MNIQPRGDRTWRLRWQDGRDPQTGKWRRVNETFHGTRKQAENRWVERQRQIDEQGNRTRELAGITVSELWALWIDTKNDLEASTRVSYDGLWRTHIGPQLGRFRVDRLTALDIQRAIVRWQTGPRADGKPGTLSARTVGYCRTLVVAMLDKALEWQLVPANVAKVVKGPRQRRKRRREEEWWTLEQAQAFIATAGHDRLAIAFLLALGTGLREGEILGLRWSDVDLERGTLRVEQTQKRAEKGYTMGRPKTDASERSIPLDTTVLNALRQHRTAQKRNRVLLGPDYRHHDLVVCTGIGTPILPSNLRRTFDRLQAKAGVPRITFHALRHTHASWLVEQGVDIRLVSDRLGHTEVSFTYQTYVHGRLDRQREAADQLGAKLWGEKRGET